MPRIETIKLSPPTRRLTPFLCKVVRGQSEGGLALDARHLARLGVRLAGDASVDLLLVVVGGLLLLDGRRVGVLAAAGEGAVGLHEGCYS